MDYPVDLITFDIEMFLHMKALYLTQPYQSKESNELFFLTVNAKRELNPNVLSYLESNEMELILCGNLFVTSNGGKAISFIAESPKFCQKTLVSHLLSKPPLQPKK